MKLESRCQPRLQSSEGLSGAGGFASKAADSCGWQVSAAAGGRPQLPAHGPLQSCFSGLTTCWLASPRASDLGSGGCHREVAMPFMTSSWKSRVTSTTSNSL